MYRVSGNLFYQCVMIWTLALSLLPSATHAAACPPTIEAQCFQAKGSHFLGGTPVQNGGEMVVAKGDPVTIRLQYCHGDDSTSAYQVNFTSTVNTNIFTGSEHTFDTETLWGGGGLSTGNNKDVLIDTASAPNGSGHIVINVTSDATGGNVLANCDFTLTTISPNGDEDGDGLLNSWEINGIDANNDGMIDLELSGTPYSAKWNHKDIFIEADYMDCAKGGCPASNPTGDHKPHPNVFTNLAAAFAAAPVSNPDRQDGITLHSFLDEGVPYYQRLLFGRPFLGSWDATFDDLKLGDFTNPCDGYFGTSWERAAPDCAIRLAARKMAFRYVLFGDRIAEAIGALGVAELPGNDFFVQVQRIFDGGSFNKGNHETDESNTFMHELGHTLGLSHGGSLEDAKINCKPNYLSVMNYMQSWEKFNASKFPLDFSRQTLPELNEGALNEVVGISGPPGRVARYGVSGHQRSGDAGGPIDWNGDGPLTVGTVAADINWIDVFPDHCGPSPEQSLRGHEDWHSLVYDFRQSVDYADLHRETPRPEDEWSRADLDLLKDDDLDTIINGEDNCMSVPNTNQANRDHDNLGDACDPDSDPPTVNLVTPAEGAALTLGSIVPADYSCADEPGGSGLASCSGTVTSGTAIDTSSVGEKTFSVTALDGEGHQTVVTHHYRVSYVFDGFFSPVDNNMLNLAKAGQAIPLKWRLTDSAGNPVLNLASVSVNVITVACSAGQTVDQVEEYATGSSGLQNLGNGNYQFNWNSPNSYAKSCKTMQLNLGEGNPRTANFQFK